MEMLLMRHPELRLLAPEYFDQSDEEVVGIGWGRCSVGRLSPGGFRVELFLPLY